MKAPIYPFYPKGDKMVFSIVRKGADYYLEGKVVTYRIKPTRYRESPLYFIQEADEVEILRYHGESCYYKLNRAAAARFVQQHHKWYDADAGGLRWDHRDLAKELSRPCYQRTQAHEWVSLDRIMTKEEISRCYEERIPLPFDRRDELKVVPMRRVTASPVNKYPAAPAVFVVYDIPATLLTNTVFPVLSGISLMSDEGRLRTTDFFQNFCAKVSRAVF